MPQYIKFRTRYDREAAARFLDMKRRMNRIMKEAQREGLNDDGLRVEIA